MSVAHGAKSGSELGVVNSYKLRGWPPAARTRTSEDSPYDAFKDQREKGNIEPVYH